MCNADPKKTVIYNTTNSICPIGEIIGKKNISESNIPVLSCEGACIRGEIARLAATNVAKEPGFCRHRDRPIHVFRLFPHRAVCRQRRQRKQQQSVPCNRALEIHRVLKLG